MSKVLISWIAFTNDFTKDENGMPIVKTDGTHGDFYSNLFDYETHILLSSFHVDTPDRKFSSLLNYLRKKVPDATIKPAYIDLEDIISVEEIKTKLFRLLNSHKDKDVEIFISPGTPSMQTAWYLLASEFENVKLFQVRPPQFRNGAIAEKEFIKVIQTGIVGGHAIKEENRRKKKLVENPFITKSTQVLFDKAEKIALAGKSTVLILGETGTGKGVLAKHIHEQSIRNKNTFFPINCGAMGDELLESRLFGYVEGAFTGAIKDVKGAFEVAHKGTLFLDEIGDISKKMQQTLLKALEDNEIYRIGGSKPIKVDVRIIAATNKELLELVQQGTFRADLYFRLAVVELETIPCRGFSKEEQKNLFGYFIEKHKLEYKRPFPKLSKEVKQLINSYWFPGNFREVSHLLEGFFAGCEDIVNLEDIPTRIQHPEENGFSLLLKDIENNHIKKVLNMFSGNKQRARKALGISYGKLNDRVKEID